MHLLTVGLNHHSAPIDLRERIALDGATLPLLLAALRAETREAVVLSTCNRNELYAVTAHRTSGARALRRFLADQVDEGIRGELDCHLYEYADEDAVCHLLRVAAGLDSLILGEPQILGQLRAALAAARAATTTGPVLDRLFETALAAGKEARATTGIARGAASIGHAAIEVARRELGGLGGRTVLVIGAGKMATIAARALNAATPKSGASATIIVLNRTPERAAALADELGGTALPFHTLAAQLSRCDVAIASTGASTPLITTALLAPVLTARPERPLLILDLAVPRDVAPEVGKLHGVTLRNIDDLRDTVTAGIATRGRERAHVEQLLTGHAARFWAWRTARTVVPAIAALQARGRAIRTEELSRALSRLEHLSSRDRNVVAALATAITNKLLHAPIARLKHPGDGSDYARAAHELFGLAQDRDDEAPQPPPLSRISSGVVPIELRSNVPVER